MTGSDRLRLDGLVAFVTGGTSGIGAAVAALLAERGARVAVADRSPDCADPRLLALRADVTDDAAVREAVSATARELGGLDILVNNAGIGAVGAVDANDDDEWRRVLDVNLLGAVRATRASLEHLRRSRAAAIVNTCSIAATAGLPNRALYSATKGALMSLTLAMAADFIPEGIRVNAVAPGTVDTPWVARLLADAPDAQARLAALRARQPIGRLVSAEEVAEAVAYLASPAASAITGTIMPVDGGMQGLRMPSSTAP
ncbi:MAG TPA: SDR family NAD(P)-dependent oxidoreductase [Solirubrobacteraceae bacterium]|nr:SDR family NAD(P)-dependent oxidoreductase [Solirubrobacteraceae bacterium]